MRSLPLLCLCAFLLAAPPLKADVNPDSFVLTDDVREALYDSPTRLLWLTGGKLNPTGEVAVKWLENVEQHGLNSRDYQLPKLHQRLRHIQPSKARATDEWLTASLLRLTEELALGRIRPAVADPEWHIK